MIQQLGPKEIFDDENQKLKDSKFEDLPLLINDMTTKASKINYNNILSGKEERAAHTESGTLVKQIDEDEMEKLANKMSRKRVRKGNDIEPDKTLEKLYSQEDGKILSAQPRIHRNPNADKRLEDAFSAVPEKEEP